MNTNIQSNASIDHKALRFSEQEVVVRLVQQVDDASYANIMKSAGVPEAYIPILVNTQKGIRDGGLEIKSNDLEKLLGRPAVPINESLSKIVSQISQVQIGENRTWNEKE